MRSRLWLGFVLVLILAAGCGEVPAAVVQGPTEAVPPPLSLIHI